MNLSTLSKYCLTLPEKPERTKAALDHFNSVNLGTVEMVDGVHGEKFGLKTVFPYEVDAPGSGFNIGHHCVGIWMSHWVIWQMVAHGSASHALIMEDDAMFSAESIQAINQALDDVPQDFDWLFLGSCCTERAGNRHIKGRVWDVRYPMCFQAYVISKAGAHKLLRTQRKVYAPIDISTTFHSFPSMSVYTVLPSVVQQFNTVIPT